MDNQPYSIISIIWHLRKDRTAEMVRRSVLVGGWGKEGGKKHRRSRQRSCSVRFWKARKSSIVFAQICRRHNTEWTPGKILEFITCDQCGIMTATSHKKRNLYFLIVFLWIFLKNSVLFKRKSKQKKRLVFLLRQGLVSLRIASNLLGVWTSDSFVFTFLMGTDGQYHDI